MPRKILVSDLNGAFHVTIPDNAKITFGPAIPFNARQEQRVAFQPADKAYSLRIYVGSKENLYAVFPDVRGFRDLSLEVEAVAEPEEDDIEMSEREAAEQNDPRPRRRRLTASTTPARTVVAPDAHLPTGLGNLPSATERITATLPRTYAEWVRSDNFTYSPTISTTTAAGAGGIPTGTTRDGGNNR